MTITAQEILNHCKAVVKGEIPQPEPLLEIVPEAFGNGFRFRWGGSYLNIVIHGQSRPEICALSARILGLDRRAPAVELEWEQLSLKLVATFNDHIRAEIFAKHEHEACIMIADYICCYSILPTEAEARAWCARQIKELVTPKL